MASRVLDTSVFSFLHIFSALYHDSNCLLQCAKGTVLVPSLCNDAVHHCCTYARRNANSCLMHGLQLDKVNQARALAGPHILHETWLP